jgi:hypothetical protein
MENQPCGTPGSSMPSKKSNTRLPPQPRDGETSGDAQALCSPVPRQEEPPKIIIPYTYQQLLLAQDFATIPRDMWPEPLKKLCSPSSDTTVPYMPPPLQTPSTSGAHPRIEPGPSEETVHYLSFDPQNLNETTKPINSQPVAFQPLNFVPRPMKEYQALTSGIIRNTKAHERRHSNLQKDPQSFPQQSYSGTSTTQFNPATSQDAYSHDQGSPKDASQTLNDGPTPVGFDKNARRSDAKSAELSPLIIIQYDPFPPTSSVSRYTMKGLPSAAELIANNRDNKQREYARPWGLQRMLTHDLVSSVAARLHVPMPSISDADVRLFCHSEDSPFQPLRSTIPPVYVDIRYLCNMEISAEEILTFFPGHLKWHDAIFRLAQNGWAPSDMSNYVNFARDLEPPNRMRANTVLKLVQAADQVILYRQNGSTIGRPSWRTTNFTTNGWVPYTGRYAFGTIDYFLVDLADGVVNFPEGDGARLLTRAVRLAVAQGHVGVRLSEIQQYIRVNLLIFPPLPSMFKSMLAGRHPDEIGTVPVHETRHRSSLAIERSRK